MADQGTQVQDQKQQEKKQATEIKIAGIVKWDPENATEAWNLARYYGESNLVPRAMQNVADIFVTIAAGRDFGWSPMQSMRGIYVVEGKPSLSADAMVGIAKKSQLCEYFRLVESTSEIATFETKRKGDPSPVKMSFTIKEASAAGLLEKKGPWKTYPQRMLRNRCKSMLCKEVYEELFFGVYEEDEAKEIEVNDPPPARLRVAPPLPPENGAPAFHGGREPTAAQAEPAKAAQSTQEQPAQKPNMELFDQLFVRIEEAPNLEALLKLVPELQKLPKEEQRAIKVDFDKKKAELEKKSA